MKPYIKSITTAALLFLGGAAVAANNSPIYFGYAPSDPDPEDLSAQGSGKNNYLEAMVRLSPSESPMLAALKGSKVTGIRCYLRSEYRNTTGKKYSCISSYTGSLDATAERETVHFAKGWNEFEFQTPRVIGDEDIYIGFQVFEVQGNPYPVTSFKPVSVPDAYFINAGRQSWDTYSDKGSLMIEAIIEPAGDTPSTCALAMTADHPLVVAPDAPFESGLYLRNLTSEPIRSAVVTVTTAEGRVTDNITIALDEPIGAFDGRVITGYEVTTGSEEGTDVPLTFTVTSINGVDAVATHPVTEHFYITRDAFTRIPLIEEFTSMTCVNCPFMFYYLEEAMEKFGHQHVYVAHHSGFNYDVFTQQVDKDMEYLFGGYQRNPAVMYDRSILPGESELVQSATSEASCDRYLANIELARRTPALASVNVVADDSNGTVTVEGRVSTGEKTADGNVFISVYLIEDGITADRYPQEGVTSNKADDAPADLVEKFRHNGVIRANLCKDTMGDKFEFDADGNYSVTYNMPEYAKTWNLDNCHYVAFIHRNNKDNLRDNYVLNAGDSRPYDPAGLDEKLTVDRSGRLKVYVSEDGVIHVVSPVRAVALYDVNGRELDIAMARTPGIYVVRALLGDGSVACAKVAVR